MRCWSLFLLLLLIVLSACQQVQSPHFERATTIFPYDLNSFAEYQQSTNQWLTNHRVPVTENPAWEVKVNSPSVCGESRSRGVLLVHGLGDSPYFFHDIARDLCAQGYQVRTILLPGHGSKPGDMLNADFDLWQRVTAHHIAQFARETDTLFLGGFSTGANLVTLAAHSRSDIAGLLLFSPAFKSNFFATRLAPYLTGIYEWPNLEREDNPTRYNSVAMTGFAAYQRSVEALTEAFDKSALSVPVFMVVAEQDSVVDVQYVADVFNGGFNTNTKLMMWLGESPPDYPNIKGYTMQLPEQKIGASSHMAVLFSPGNVLYGTKAKLRICDNGQSEEKTLSCENGDPVWFGPWGLTEEGKVFARLTYNPYYPLMMQQILTFMTQTQTVSVVGIE